MDVKCSVMRQVCHGCLSLNNTEPINSELSVIYNAMGVDINSVPFPVTMCVNCRYLMQRYNAFRMSCLNANKYIVGLFLSESISLHNIEKAASTMKKFLNLTITQQNNAFNFEENALAYDTKDFCLNNFEVEDENEEKPNKNLLDEINNIDQTIQDQQQSTKQSRYLGLKEIQSDDTMSADEHKQKTKTKKTSPKSKKQINYLEFKEDSQSDGSSSDNEVLQRTKTNKERANKRQSLSKLKKQYDTDSIDTQSVNSDELEEFDLKDESSDESFKSKKVRKNVKLTKKVAKTVKTTIKKEPKEVKKKQNKKKVTTNNEKKCNQLSEEDKIYFDECIEVKKLSLAEQIQEFEKKKLNKVYRMATFKCELCYTGFIVQERYDQHMERHRASDPKFEMCGVCKRYLRDKRALKHHIGMFHTNLSKCKKCNFTTISRTAALLHMRWHKGTVYKCEQCASEFKRASSLLSHIRISHTSDHVCVYCGYAFVGKRGLMKHVDLKHKHCGEVPPEGPRCDICSITFLDESALQAHLLVSPKHGVNKRNVDESERKNRVMGQKICHICDLLMPTKSEYVKHFNEEHPTEPLKLGSSSIPVLCDVCGKVFKSQFQLRDHMTDHFKDLPLHKCDKCNKTYRKKASLNIHKIKHKGIVHPCNICGQTFTLKYNMERHRITAHSSGDNVKCEFCDKRFKSTAHRKVHTDHVHLNKPWPKRDRGKKLD